MNVIPPNKKIRSFENDKQHYHKKLAEKFEDFRENDKTSITIDCWKVAAIAAAYINNLVIANDQKYVSKNYQFVAHLMCWIASGRPIGLTTNYVMIDDSRLHKNSINEHFAFKTAFEIFGANLCNIDDEDKTSLLNNIKDMPRSLIDGSLKAPPNLNGRINSQSDLLKRITEKYHFGDRCVF